MTEQEAALFKPKLVYCNEHNEVIGTGDAIPAQAA
jgi:aspartate 1-decarboxylase